MKTLLTLTLLLSCAVMGQRQRAVITPDSIFFMLPKPEKPKIISHDDSTILVKHGKGVTRHTLDNILLWQTKASQWDSMRTELVKAELIISKLRKCNGEDRFGNPFFSPKASDSAEIFKPTHRHLEDKQAPTLSNGQVKCLSCAEWYYPTRAEKKATSKTALGTTVIKEYDFITWQDLSEMWKEWEDSCNQYQIRYFCNQDRCFETHYHTTSYRETNNLKAFVEFALRRNK